MSEPDHVAVMKRAKELCAQDGFAWWEITSAVGPNPSQRLVSDDRRQEYMARARDQLRGERLGAAAEVFHNSIKPVPATPAAPRGRRHKSQDSRSPTTGFARDAGIGELLQTHISGRFWHGKAPPPLSAPPDGGPSRVERTLKVVVTSAARSPGWMALPGGLALIGLAAWLILHLPPSSQSMPGDTSAAALQPASSPLLAPPISPGLPAGVVEARSKQVQAPSAPITQARAGPAEHKTVRWRRTPDHRSRFIARGALFAQRPTPLFADRCPYQCSWAEAMRGGDN
jgi:hypothetical protein